MTGWKSKWGGIASAFGAALLAAAQVVTDPQIKMWVQAIGTALAVGGASLLGIGIAHKVEKTK